MVRSVRLLSSRLPSLTSVSRLQPKIAAPKLTKPSAAGGKKAAQNVYTIDCTKPAEDRIFDVAGFEKYLHDNMKVDGKPGQLGSLVEIKRVGTSSPALTPFFDPPSSKGLYCIMHHSHGSPPSSAVNKRPAVALRPPHPDPSPSVLLSRPRGGALSPPVHPSGW